MTRHVNWFRYAIVMLGVFGIAAVLGALTAMQVIDALGYPIGITVQVLIGGVVGHFGVRLTRPWWFPPAAPPAPARQWTEDQL